MTVVRTVLGLRYRLLAAITLVSLCLLYPACQSTSRPDSAPPGPRVLPVSGPARELAGRLVYAGPGGLWALDLSSGATQVMVRFPPGAFGGFPAVSPDGSLLVYSLFSRGAEPKDPGGSDLYVATLDGQEQRLVLAHEEPSESLSEPSWSPDGRSIYFTRRMPKGPPSIWRVGLDGSGIAPIVDDAHSPNISPDGKQMVYLTTDPSSGSHTLWLAESDGSSRSRLVGPPEFSAIAWPRFSPDSRWIVFAAVAGAATAEESSGGALFEPPTVYAHGVPWDIWLIGTDGAGLRRLTDIGEDSPVPAWSPDGEWIAFTGELGVYLVDREGKRLRRLFDTVSIGGLAWLMAR